MMDNIRVFVVDDHPMIRHGLAAMLAGVDGLEWVGDAADGNEAVRAAPLLQPDVVVADLQMPLVDGIATIAALRPLLPHARFVLLTTALESGETRRALAAGATGFLLKSATVEELAAVIRTTRDGPRVLAREAADALVADDRGAVPGHDLTGRERELLALMARGLSNQDISTELAIAMPTVKFHVTNILAKLNADNRTEAVLVALRHRLVKLDQTAG